MHFECAHAVRAGMCCTAPALPTERTSTYLGRPALQRQLEIGVEAVKQPAGYLNKLRVAVHDAETADQDVQPRRFRRIIALVRKVGFMHDPCDLAKHSIVEAVMREERLERTGTAVVG